MKKILALDLGTTTGWAYTHEDGRISSGSFNLASNRYEGGGMRFLRFRQQLDYYRRETKGFDEVYFEEVRAHKGVKAAHMYGGFQAHLAEWCEEKEIPYSGVPVGTIKKFITGMGNAGKAEVIKAVKQKGFLVQDDNQADAIALLLYILDSK